jgi:phage/plasmid-associated DNA primase
MNAEFPPPDARLAGKVKVVQLAAQRDILRMASDDPWRIGGDADACDPRAPQYSDDALALAFAQRHAHDLRFVASRAHWLFWDGCRWSLDKTLRAFDLARAICREQAGKCDNARAASAVASAKTVAAVERLAKADRRLAATTEQWDADPEIFNTPSEDKAR